MTQATLFQLPGNSGQPAAPDRPYTWAQPRGWRTSKLTRCRTCKAHILRGANDDWCAFQIDADPTPLTPLGEVLALVAGIRTLTARRNHHRLLLTRRGRSAIITFPAGGHKPGNRWDVIPEHHCHTTWPPEAFTDSAITPPTFDDDKECPF